MDVFNLMISFNLSKLRFWDATHQLPRVATSHLDVSTSLCGRSATSRPVDLRGASQLHQSAN